MAQPDPHIRSTTTSASSASEAADRATAEARREWLRLAAAPLAERVGQAERVTLVADLVWQRGYASNYHTAYTAVAERVGAAAARAAKANTANLDEWFTMARLGHAATEAGQSTRGGKILAPPADRDTLTAALATEPLRHQQPWQPIARTAWARGVRAGAIAGAVTAATDIIIGWRAHGGERSAEGARIDGRPARAWVADLLAAVNRDTVTAVAVPATPTTATRPTAAQLARQDQAPGVATAASTATGTGTRRVPPAAAAPTTRARSR